MTMFVSSNEAETGKERAYSARFLSAVCVSFLASQRFTSATGRATVLMALSATRRKNLSVIDGIAHIPAERRGLARRS